MFKWLQKWFTNNLWIKIIALILAVLSWLYINEEVKQGTTIQPPNFLSRFVEQNPILSKSVPIVPKMKNKPPRGYEIKQKEIYISPSTCEIWGRRNRIKKINSIYTSPINIEGKTETFKTRLRLEKISGVILPENSMVEVKIPIVESE